MKAIFKKPNAKPEIINIVDELSVFQNLVDGYIETVNLSYYDSRFTNTKILAIVDEQGVLKDKEPNIMLNNGKTILVGNVVFISQKGDCFASLTNKDINKIMEVF